MLKHYYNVATGTLKYGVGTLQICREAIYKKQAVQRTWELMCLVGMLKNISPKIILEIGTHNGGTLFCWAKVAQEEAIIISIDLPGGEFGGGYEVEDIKRFNTFLEPKQSLHCLRMNSHSFEAFEKVNGILNGELLDFLFIDGDHTFEGVKQDFIAYAPLVRKGGLIAFHDILDNPLSPTCGVPTFWRLLKNNYKTKEFIDATKHQYGMGIGVITKE